MATMMNASRKTILIGVAVAALALGAAGFWYMNSYAHPLPIAEGDTVESWQLSGTYKDGGELEKRATDEIARLEGLFGNPEGEPTDYNLHVSIANQYELLGDGEAAYEHLGRAVAIDSEKTGLAWYNLGSLVNRLGAYNTARIAYANAVSAQPNIEQYQISYLEFLVNHFPEDTAVIEAVFNSAENQFKNPAAVLQIKAKWYVQTGNIQEAVTTLVKMQSLMPTWDPAVDAEIARLRASL